MTVTFIKAAILGHPVAHSKSPLIHNHWIAKYNLAGEYGAFDVAPENFEITLKKLIAEGYSGFNITLPHKERALELCDEIDAQARNVGAVNTIIMRGGKIHGSNTDAFGFTQNIMEGAPDFDFAAGPAVILGAGGAARAALQGLLRNNVPEIRIANRTRDKAEDIARGYKNVKIFDWDGRSKILGDINLLVNTTSLGLANNSPLDMDLTHLNPGALVNDMVYVPLMTKLLVEAKARGNPVVTGIGMLLHQARPAFEIWFGVMPDIDADLLKKVRV